MSETLEGWLDQEIKDAGNVVGMYRSYRQGDCPDAMSALARLHALEDVRKKMTELWGLKLPQAQSESDTFKGSRVSVQTPSD